MDMQGILNAIQEFVIIPMIGVIGVGVTIVLKALAEYIVRLIKDARLKKYVKIATDSITLAVNKTNQQFVDSLKLSGEFNPDNYAQAFEQTKETAKSMLNDTCVEVIGEAYKDFDTWLEAQIYAQIRLNKLTLPAIVK